MVLGDQERAGRTRRIHCWAQRNPVVVPSTSLSTHSADRLSGTSSSRRQKRSAIPSVSTVCHHHSLSVIRSLTVYCGPTTRPRTVLRDGATAANTRDEKSSVLVDFTF